jgi:DNA invertase Pin-like site-specific DNA recombinase
MGRLTLNVLLSFAQFEREVTGERIRDKIAASKKKGIWMGGMPPLGYDVKNRKLVVNDAEARIVVEIYLRRRRRTFRPNGDIANAKFSRTPSALPTRSTLKFL